MKSCAEIHLSDVQSVYSGPERQLWELLMGEQIYTGGWQSSLDLAERAGIGQGQKGVDLCCATGAGMRFLLRFRGVSHMTGVDATRTMLDLGRQRCTDEGLADRVKFVESGGCGHPRSYCDVPAAGMRNSVAWDMKPRKLKLAEWNDHYRELHRDGLPERDYGGPLNRLVLKEGDLRLHHLQFDNSAAALRLWNFLLTENERLHQARARGEKIVGTMKDLGTIPVMAYSLRGVRAFYPDGARWTPRRSGGRIPDSRRQPLRT